MSRLRHSHVPERGARCELDATFLELDRHFVRAPSIVQGASAGATGGMPSSEWKLRISRTVLGQWLGGELHFFGVLASDEGMFLGVVQHCDEAHKVLVP